jgi:hypothetical protein
MSRLPFLLLALPLVACKLPLRKHDAGAPPPIVTPTPTLDPLTPKWSDFDLKFSELSATAMGFFTVSGTAYDLRFTGFPSGTTITINGKTTAVAATGYSERVDIADRMADLSPSDAMSWTYKLDPKIDFTISVPGYRPTPLSAPTRSVSYAIKDWVSKAIDHPVLFSHETSSDPAPAAHSILYTGAAPEAYGPAMTMRDVDWVAVVEKAGTKKTKTCAVKPSPYGPTGKPAITSVTLDMSDEQVTVVERKTSKVISKKTFAAKSDCPTYAYAPTQITVPDELEKKRWVRDERTAHP